MLKEKWWCFWLNKCLCWIIGLKKGGVGGVGLPKHTPESFVHIHPQKNSYMGHDLLYGGPSVVDFRLIDAIPSSGAQTPEVTLDSGGRNRGNWGQGKERKTLKVEDGWWYEKRQLQAARKRRASPAEPQNWGSWPARATPNRVVVRKDWR
ncbi:hypothetical protein C8J57DRAFT_1220331 [Mycena rebaudengoi]|nr:hypothetical protein C8J57DRAFT_1220331 [Mycena rebaudengoi]